LSRPVSQHGVRTAPLSGEPSGYRSLSAGTSKQALSHGIKYHDEKTGKTSNFLTENFAIPVQTVADLYRYRWQVGFKWIKQHLRIKSFFGTSENAVKTQIWIAISVYVQVAIIKKRLDLSTDLYTMLQILSLTLFEKVYLEQMLANCDYKTEECDISNQLNLFDNLTGQ
jgi:hypothetical protein